MRFITRHGRVLLLTVMMVVGAACVSNGDRPSALVGHWVHYEDGKPEKIELFKDGTGVMNGVSITWKVENNRLVFLSASEGLSCNYNVSGYELIIACDDDDSATFVKKENLKEYKKKKESGKKEIAENTASEICEFFAAEIKMGTLTSPIDINAISRMIPGEGPGDGPQQVITCFEKDGNRMNTVVVPSGFRATIDGDFVVVTYVNNENIFGRFRYR
jgi:hypothetical protein